MDVDEILLKEQLRKIKENNYAINDEIDSFTLALRMLEKIGSPDPELRDTLIYNVIGNWIINGIFTPDQLRKLLNISLNEKHLFLKLGEKETDSVFTRTFSVLIIPLILMIHVRKNFLSEAEIMEVKEKVFTYTISEQDLRGYVKGKGWAHAMAHAADTLNLLVKYHFTDREDLLKILRIIQKKFSINEYVYINAEEERMITVVMSILKRDILTASEMVSWIKSFEEYITTNSEPEEDIRIHNIKHFLSSMYFRLRQEIDNPVKEMSQAIEDTLTAISKKIKVY
jgi:hypothetical protein